MADMLNLDELVKEKRVLTLKGVTHDMKEMTVQDFIEITKLIEDRGGEKEISQHDEIEAVIKMVQDSFPTIPDDQIRELNIAQLNAIVDFTKQSVDEIAEDYEEKK